MNEKKRIIGIVLCAALFLSLVACGRRVERENAGEEPIGETQKGSAIEGGTATGETPQPERIEPIPVGQKLLPYEIPQSRGLAAFSEKCLPLFLGEQYEQNTVFSPLNIYMALGMLCELTESDSREQLMKLLACEDIGALREELAMLWSSADSDTEQLTLLQSASLWLRDDMPYKDEPLERLTTAYSAESFTGKMGSADYNRQLCDWVDEQTKHLLENESRQLSFDPQTVMSLVTTLYLRGSWTDPFDEGLTQEGVFHALRGEQPAAFMHRGGSMAYYEGEGFAAVYLPMNDGVGMWLFLPDEGGSLQELIDGGAVASMLCAEERVECQMRRVNLSLPKFDVESGTKKLIGHLEKLGLSDIFDPARADFSPLCDTQTYVSDILHAARVRIDENGCEAAAFTVIIMKAAGAIDETEPVDFICDRPFLFAVTMDQGPILFAGAVNSME